ncbi:MAG TPA: galactose oxidase-like domain-containing protein [Burkholderiaceae bacterium]|nr:galactose oxidase-like domain-containing protein [Burkholderiaceae bacterium]
MGAIPADAHINGMWSSVGSWPLIQIHAVLLIDGRVLTYGTNAAGKQTGYFIYDVWDPSAGLAGGHLTLPNGTGVDTFCSAQIVLPRSGGEVFLAGGDLWDGANTMQRGNRSTLLFDPANNSLTSGADMYRPRWYATTTTLLNGEVLIVGGRDGEDLAEVRQVDGTFRPLTDIDATAIDYYYPRHFVAPDGRVFGYDSKGYMYYIDAAGAGAISQQGRLAIENRGNDASAAMFAPGKILQFGGASNGAVVIDITGGSPVVTPTQSMSTQRRIPTATLLADGKVLATGGSEVWNQLTGANLYAEIWDPATGTWTLGAKGALARLYHSNAMLLPDGSVLVGGGGAPGPLNNLNAEIYYPPYFFRSGGQLARRPVIAAAPGSVEIGKSFTVDYDNATSIKRVALIKTGAVTHSFNMDQRFVPLTFTASGKRLTVKMPSRAADAPPGYYLLFLIDADGVPSIGKIVRRL